ncbi:MAG TPA: hypothetical protein VFS43_39315 [Polyangiaceae bacterium]|nr:hypothetical protein [Polyangiaceae bacterium]
MERPPVLSYLPPGHDPFAAGERAPEALAYFRAYCVLSSLLCGAVAALLVAAAVGGFGPSAHDPDDWLALVFCVVGALGALAFGAAHVVGVVAPRRPWVHTFGLVLLAAGILLQGCCFPLAIALLVYWSKPEVKAWFQGPAPPGPG